VRAGKMERVEMRTLRPRPRWRLGLMVMVVEVAMVKEEARIVGQVVERRPASWLS